MNLQQKNLTKMSYGFTLLELLIAMSLSCLLTIAVLHVYFSVSDIYQFQQNKLTLNANGRFAIHFLSKKIRTTGYIGCGKFTENFPLINHTQNEFSPQSVLKIYPAELPQESDRLQIQYASMQNNELCTDMISANTFLLDKNTLLQPEQLIILSECSHAEVDQIQTVQHLNYGTRITTKHLLNKQYLKGTLVSPIEQDIFFIADTARKTKKGLPVYSLYQLNSVNNTKEELIENVIAMTIKIGVENTAHQIIYVAPELASSFKEIKSLKINLLLVSQDEITPEPQGYFYNEKWVIPKDKRLYKEFETYIALRERFS